MTRSFISTALASSLALTAVTSVPAQADEEDVLKALLVGAVIAGIANALDDDDDEASADPAPVDPVDPPAIATDVPPPILIDPSVLTPVPLLPMLPVTHSTDILDVPQTWTADFDAGSVGAGDDADIWFQSVNGIRYLHPRNGAQISVGDRSNRGYVGCSTARYSSTRVQARAVPEGSYVCMKTSEGRVSQFRVNDYTDASPTTMRVGYTTWR